MAKEVKYSKTGQSLLIKALGYSPKLRILDLFLTNPFFDFSSFKHGYVAVQTFVNPVHMLLHELKTAFRGEIMKRRGI
jgi:hypothetical protein